MLLLLQEANRLLSQNRIQDAVTKAEEALAGVPDLVEAEDLRKQVEALSTEYSKHGTRGAYPYVSRTRPPGC